MENFFKDRKISTDDMIFDLQRFEVLTVNTAITADTTVPASARVVTPATEDYDAETEPYTGVSLRGGISGGKVTINKSDEVLEDGSPIGVQSISGGTLEADLSGWVNGADLSTGTISGTGAVNVKVTDSADAITVGDVSSSGNISINTAGDKDTIKISGISNGNVSIDAGDEDNLISIGGAISGGDVSLVAADGNDTISIGGAIGGNNVLINAGDGTNIVSVGGGISGGKVTINGGTDVDEISVGDITNGTVIIDGGADSDKITVSKISGGEVTVHGGDSNDADEITITQISNGTLNVFGGDEADTIKVNGITGGKITVDAGDGENVVTLDGAIKDSDILILGGSEYDTVALDEISTSTVSVNAGADDDSISVNKVTSGELTIDGGAGSDIISINAADGGAVSISGGTDTDEDTIFVGSATADIVTIDAVAGDIISIESGIVNLANFKKGDEYNYVNVNGVAFISAADSSSASISVSSAGIKFLGDDWTGTLTAADSSVNNLVVYGNTNDADDKITLNYSESNSGFINNGSFTSGAWAMVNNVSVFEGTTVAAVGDYDINPNSIIVKSEPSEYSIAGGYNNNEVVFKSAIKGKVTVETSDGNDTISIGSGISGGTVSINVGEGANIVSVGGGISGGNVTIKGGNESDEINLGAVSTSTVSIDAGESSDKITLDEISGSNLNINGGADDDTISVNNVTSGELTINGGAGYDSIAIAEVADGSVNVDGGNDTDNILISKVSGGTLTISGGANDEIEIISVGTVSKGTVSIDGGAGTDSIAVENISGAESNVNVNGGTDADTITVGEIAGGNISISGGNGSDDEGTPEVISVGNVSGGNVTLDGGAGLDSIAVDTVTDGAVSISGGNGADTILVGNATANLVTIDADEGDNISVTSGVVNLANFKKDAAVTINGVEFVSGADSSASLSFANNKIQFLSSDWSGMLKAVDGQNITVQGNSGNADDFVTLSSSEETSRQVNKGSFTNGVWAVVNGINIFDDNTTASIVGDEEDTNNITVRSVAADGKTYKVIGGSNANNIIFTSSIGGAVVVQAEGGDDTISVGTINGGTVSVDAGAGYDSIAVDEFISGKASIFGGAADDTISVNKVTDGELTINGGADVDMISINAADGGKVSISGGDGEDIILVETATADIVTIDAGKGDSISVGAGVVNFVNFKANEAVTINGVEFIADANSSASLSFNNDTVTFLDTLWSGTLSAENNVTFYGATATDTNYGGWTYTTSDDENTYHVINGTFFENAWAIVNGRGKGNASETDIKGSDDVANNITVKAIAANESFSVSGGTEADKIIIESITGGDKVIYGLDSNDTITIQNTVTAGNTTINAGTEDDLINIASINGGNVTIDTGDGNDVVTIGGAIVGGNVSISAGEGAGEIKLESLSGGNVDIKLNAEDAISSVNLKALDSGNFTVNGGNGADEIKIETVVGGSVNVDGGAGIDSITVENVSGTESKVTVNGGDDADVISLGSISGGEVSVSGGANDEVEKISVDKISGGNVTLDGGAGTDSITVENISGAESKVTIGGGDDVDTITVNEIADGNVYVDGGAGSENSDEPEIISVGKVSGGNVTLNGGAGYDSIAVDEVTSGKVSISGGDGADTILVGNATADIVTIDAGAGDNISITSGVVNLANFAEGEDNAVIINGVSLISAANSKSASISVVGSNQFQFLDGNWSGTINSSEDSPQNITVYGNAYDTDKTDFVTLESGGMGTNKHVNEGTFFGGAWAIVNGDVAFFEKDLVATGLESDVNDIMVKTVPTVDSKTYSVVGGSFEDTINFASEVTGSIVVDADEGADTISVGSGINGGTVSINAGAGENFVTIGGITNSANVSAIGGDTYDTITVDEISNSTFIVNAGDDSDYISLIGAVNGNVTLDAGDGDDEISISGAINGGNVSINGGDGADKIALSSVSTPANVNVVAGADDEITVQSGAVNFVQFEADKEVIINGVTFIAAAENSASLSFEDNKITFLDSSWSGTVSSNNPVSLIGSDGESSLVIDPTAEGYRVRNGIFPVEWATINGEPFDSATVLTGTADNDQIQVTVVTEGKSYSVDGAGGEDVIEIEQLAGGSITVSGGDDKDAIDVTNGVSGGTLNVYGKGGDDGLLISSVVSGGSITIDGGAGDDNFTLTTISGGDVNLIGGDGEDTFSIETIGAEGNVTINAGTGDSIGIGGGALTVDISAGDIAINDVNFNSTVASSAKISVDSAKDNITVDGYTGEITAGVIMTVSDNRGATVTGETAYKMTNGEFATWATINNNSFVVEGINEATGTEGKDTIQISSAASVMVDGNGGVDTITAESLTGATIVATSDNISVANGDVRVDVTNNSTINGAVFTSTNEYADLTISGNNVTVDTFTGSITAGNATIFDKNGSSVTGGKNVEINEGVFTSWATIVSDLNQTLYAVDTVAVGTSGNDSITVIEVADVSINGLAGIDTITAVSLTGSTINAATDFISVTGGDIYAEISTDSTINGATFTGNSNASISIGDNAVTVNNFTGNIAAGTATVSDNRGAAITGTRAYKMEDGAFSTWATVNANESYAFDGDTVVTGTEGADTITISDAASVSVDGNGGFDTITADSLTGSTINADDDYISVTSGDFVVDNINDITINGASFTGADTMTASVTISGGIVKVDKFSGDITAGNATVSDNRGATISGAKVYEMTNGQFATWATVNNQFYALTDETVINGTDGDDTINIAEAPEDVLIDGNGGVDTITADSLSGATINAATDNINVGTGDFYAVVSTDSTINGATFAGNSNADISITDEGMTVGEFSGTVTANNNLTITDDNGLTVKSAKTYEMESGAFVTWATLNNDTYFFNIADTVATGTEGDDNIEIASATNVSIDGKGGTDNIFADTLHGATINATSDNINVETGDFYAEISADSTINGAVFTGNSTANITIGSEVTTVDNFTGKIDAGSLTIADKRGATVDGYTRSEAYSMTDGVFNTWATINGDTYKFEGETEAIGTPDNDTIQISDAADVLIDGNGGTDTITADSLTNSTIVASGDVINVKNGAIKVGINDGSTINGAQFIAESSNADITISGSNASLDVFTGDIVAGTLTVYDKNGRGFTGNNTYTLEEGELTSWATINGDTYILYGETVATGTDGNDTIQISSVNDVLIDGKGGVDTITADSLSGATINAATDFINVTGGDITAVIATDSTINGATFTGNSTAEISINDVIVTVKGFTGSVAPGGLIVYDKNGAAVNDDYTYKMSDGAFTSWATINGTTKVFDGVPEAPGTPDNDTIQISSAASVMVDGLAGVDTITADSLSGATINAATDYISVTAGDVTFDIANNSTINGAVFTGNEVANVTISGNNVTVDTFTGSITAGNSTITDRRGSTISGGNVYEMTDGAFASWATINNNSYALIGDTVVTGTDGDDTINIVEAPEKVLIDGLAGVDTITADSLTGATINAATDYISVTGGDIYAVVSTDSTINGAIFTGNSTANITFEDNAATVDNFTGNIAAGTATVTDNRGASIIGSKSYIMDNGVFSTWATINNGENYAFTGDTVATGTTGDDTIKIISATDVSINGNGGEDTIIADTLTGSTIEATGDYIKVTSGNVKLNISNDANVNGAQFSGTSTADVTIDGASLNVDKFTGEINAGSLTVIDNRGATVTGNRDYTITGGVFETWATINNGESYSFAGDTNAVGTENNDTIQISSAADVSIDGLAGADTITADSLTGATINAATDNISVTGGDIYAVIATDSTINGATFTGDSNAFVTINGSNLNVEEFTGNIAAGNATVSDNRGATVTGETSYKMTSGEFETWATINNNSYVVEGDTVAVGTNEDDTIEISSAENVSINGLAGVDTITADSLTGATIDATGDYIKVTSGTIDLNVVTSSTINGAQFDGTGAANVTLDGSTIHLDTWTGYVTFDEDITLYDKTGASIEAGNREFRNGVLRTIHSWATINGDTYALEDQDTVAVGTEGNDTINLEPYDNVSVNGLGGIDTITADSIGAGVTIVANDDLINIENGAATFQVSGKSTINGAQFNGTGNAQLTLSSDTISVSDWTGGVILTDNLTLSDKAGSTLNGVVNPYLTNGTVSGITGLNDNETITFGGDTYAMTDGVLNVTRSDGKKELYLNATSDTDLLALTDPYAYVQISDNTFNLDSGAALIKDGYANVIYGTEPSYTNDYCALLTKDGDAYNLAQKNMSVDEPQLVSSDVKILTADFNATLSATSGKSTINGDAYNATTAAKITVTPTSSSLIEGTVNVTSGTLKTSDGNSYETSATSDTGVIFTALEGTVTDMSGTGAVAASMNEETSFTTNDVKYNAAATSNVNITLENNSAALNVTSGNITAELEQGQTSKLNDVTYTGNEGIAQLNATANFVTLTMPADASVTVDEVIYTGLEETNAASFTSVNGTVALTTEGRFKVDVPQNNSAVIDATTYTSNQNTNTFEVPVTGGVNLTSTIEKELDIADVTGNSTYDYMKVDVTASVGAATLNSADTDGTGKLIITGSDDATVSVSSDVTSAYKLNDKTLRINGDSDGYGAIASSDGTLTRLDSISGGASVSSAPSVTLNTDSVGDYTFNNGAVTIGGDQSVALMTDENSNLVSVGNFESGELFTKLEDFNLNGKDIGIYGDDGVTLQADSAGNIVSVGGVADKATINGVGNATVELPDGGTLTINDTPFALSDDDGVTISGGRVNGLDVGGKLQVGKGGSYIVNGVALSVPASGGTISADNASTPYVYTGQTANDSLANKLEEVVQSDDNINVNDSDTDEVTNIDLAAEGKKSVVISDIDSEKEVNVDATGTDGAFIYNDSEAKVNVGLGKNTTVVASGSSNEVLDAAQANKAIVVANNGANITNYNPVENAIKILLDGVENIVQAIRTNYLEFSNNAISFGGHTINFSNSTGGTTNTAELYNLYMQPTSVQWSNDEGGEVVGDTRTSSRNATQVMIGNKNGNKGSANIKGSNANLIAFIGAGDVIDAGGGDNYIEITTDRNINSQGANIVLNEKTGQDVIVGFQSGFEDNADKISVSGTNQRPSFKFRNGRLIMQNNNRRVTFQNAYGSSSDSAGDSGNVSKILFASADGDAKYAIADVNSTIKAGNDNAADVYIGSGSTSGVDFSDYENDVTVNLSSDQFQNIGQVTGAYGTHSLMGSDSNETLNAGIGNGSVWGAAGNDLLTGAESDSKTGRTTFFFMEGDGVDTIANFEAYDSTRKDKADVFSTYNQIVTGVYTVGDDVKVRVGSGDDIVNIKNMKNKAFAVNLFGKVEGAQVGSSFNYDNFTTYYYGTSDSTLNVNIENYADDINIWLDGSDNKYYHDVKFVDASNSYRAAKIAGNDLDNKLIASSGKTSLWGGTGGDDTLVGGDGDDTFFYGYGNGDDVLDGVNSNDVVRAFNVDLSQISNIDITETNIKVTFNNDHKLSVNSANSGAQFVLDDGSVYTCDQVTRTWTKK